MSKEFLKKLNKTYKGTPVSEDVFGRRQATPKEVAERLSICGEEVLPTDHFPTVEPLYPPRPVDIYRKEEHLSRRRQSRKPR